MISCISDICLYSLTKSASCICEISVIFVFFLIKLWSSSSANIIRWTSYLIKSFMYIGSQLRTISCLQNLNNLVKIGRQLRIVLLGKKIYKIYTNVQNMPVEGRNAPRSNEYVIVPILLSFSLHRSCNLSSNCKKLRNFFTLLLISNPKYFAIKTICLYSDPTPTSMQNFDLYKK